MLINAFQIAARLANPARLHVFAAARDLLRYTSKTLGPDPTGRVRRRTAYPARCHSAGPFIADALHGDLLAAIHALRNDARHRPHVTVSDRTAADRFLADTDATSVLQGLYDLFGSYLEQALQPIEPHVSSCRARVPSS